MLKNGTLFLFDNNKYCILMKDNGNYFIFALFFSNEYLFNCDINNSLFHYYEFIERFHTNNLFNEYEITKYKPMDLQASRFFLKLCFEIENVNKTSVL